MKIKEGVDCDNCNKHIKNARIYKGNFLCWNCYAKRVIIINRALVTQNLPKIKSFKELKEIYKR